MRADIKSGGDRQSIILTIENDAETDIEVAAPSPHLHVILRSEDGNVVQQSFGSMLDTAGSWQTVATGGRAELTVNLRRHYAGAAGTFTVECQLPTRSPGAARQTFLVVTGTVDLAILELPPRDA